MSRRERLRPAHDANTLHQLYQRPHQHSRWDDHRARVAGTIRFAAQHIGPVDTAADLSCGDGAILRGLEVEQRIYGDFAPGYTIRGPIEDTIAGLVDVDLLVCCETLEHLDDPDAVLCAARPRAEWLLISTPVEAWGDTNPEHYWAWDAAAVQDMLTVAEYEVTAHEVLDFRHHGPAFYAFGLWAARRVGQP